MKRFLIILGLMFFWTAESFAACYTDSTTKGKADATIIGIEYQDHCTFLLLANDFNSTFVGHDDAPFLAGRFTYLSLDPTNVESYKSILTLATTALVTKTRIYAEFTSRTGRIDKFSLSTQSNTNQ